MIRRRHHALSQVDSESRSPVCTRRREVPGGVSHTTTGELNEVGGRLGVKSKRLVLACRPVSLGVEMSRGCHWTHSVPKNDLGLWLRSTPLARNRQSSAFSPCFGATGLRDGAGATHYTAGLTSSFPRPGSLCSLTGAFGTATRKDAVCRRLTGTTGRRRYGETWRETEPYRATYEIRVGKS